MANEIAAIADAANCVASCVVFSFPKDMTMTSYILTILLVAVVMGVGVIVPPD